MELAQFYAQTYSRLEAIATLDQVLTLDPLHREAHLLKADQLARGPDPQSVLASLDPYLSAHPDDREAMHKRVLALVRLDRLDEVPAGWQDFTGIRGVGYDFSGRKLNGGSFRGNQMYEASFAGSELRDADFSEALLGKADLQGAILDGANLRSTGLEDADLRGASLKGVDLSTTRLHRALYDDATSWPDGFDPIAAWAQKWTP